MDLIADVNMQNAIQFRNNSFTFLNDVIWRKIRLKITDIQRNFIQNMYTFIGKALPGTVKG